MSPTKFRLHHLTFQHYIVFIFFSLYIITKVLLARIYFLITLGESTPRDLFLICVVH